MNEDCFSKEALNQIMKNTYKLTADKIITILQSIKNNPNISSKRLFWELIQNATDVKYEKEKISIQIILSKDKLLFKHNGKYFTLKDILGLFQQVSAKDSQNLEGQTGKFGTGFIGTHYLSSIIDVNGIIKINDKEFREFEIKLDRSETRSEYLAKDIEKTLEAFLNFDKKSGIFKSKKKNYLINRKETDYDTCFTYSLKDTYDIAKEGIEDLNNTIPITLVILNKKIKQITIIDEVNQIEKTYITNIEGDEKYNDITEFTVKIKYKIKNTQFEDNIYFLSYLKVDNQNKKEILKLIKEVRKENEMIVLLNRDINRPVLYRDFPLIGSNEFNMPFYINGNNFNPLEARNGLVLNGIIENNKESKENLDILEEAYNSTIEFIKCILKNYNCLKNKFLLASSKMPKPIINYDNFASNWFYEKQKFLREKLRDLPLVKCDENHKLRVLLLPIFNENYNYTFYDVVSNINLKKKVLPDKEDYKNWFNIIVGENNEIKNIELKDNIFIRSWGTTKNENNGVEEINYLYNEIDLLKDIVNCKNIKSLSDKLEKENKSEIIKYLNELILFLKNNCKYEIILNKYPIIPNRNGDFKKLEELYTDHNNRIPKEIMEIYDSISEKKLNEELVDSEIKFEYLGDLLKIKNFDSISDNLNNFILENKNIEITKKFVAYPLLSIESDNKNVTEAYKFLTSLHKLNKKNLSIKMKIPIYLWEIALKFWFNEFPKEIENFSNIDALKANLINNNKDDENVLNWMNQYLDFLESNSQNKDFKKLKIFPNQNRKFCTLGTLHYDSGFPEQFKNILKKYCNIDKREILLDKRIIAYKSYQIMPESDITNEIELEFKKFKQKKEELENIIKNNKENNKAIINKLEEIKRKLKDMAFEILCLYPKNKSKDNIKKYIEKIIFPPRNEKQLSQNPLDYLGFAEIIYNKKDKFQIEYIDTETLNYLVYINYIMEMLCDEIEQANNLENAIKRFYGINTRDDLVIFLTNIIKFIWEKQNSDLPIKSCIDIQTSEKAVFLNMEDKLLSIGKIKARENFDDLCGKEDILLDVCLNKHINKNYRSELINKKLNQNLLENNNHRKFHKYKLKDICDEIDKAIDDYYHDTGSKKENCIFDQDFLNLIQNIKKLEFDKEKMKKYFPKYWRNRTRIAISFINEDDADELLSCVNEGDIKQQIKFLKLYNDNPEIRNELKNNNNNCEELKKGFNLYIKNKKILTKDADGANELLSCVNEGDIKQQIKFLKLYNDNLEIRNELKNNNNNCEELKKGFNLYIKNKKILSKDADGVNKLLSCAKEGKIEQQVECLKIFNEDPEILNDLKKLKNNKANRNNNIENRIGKKIKFIKKNKENKENIVREFQISENIKQFNIIILSNNIEYEIKESFNPNNKEMVFNIKPK